MERKEGFKRRGRGGSREDGPARQTTNLWVGPFEKLTNWKEIHGERIHSHLAICYLFMDVRWMGEMGDGSGRFETLEVFSITTVRKEEDFDDEVADVFAFFWVWICW